MRSSILAIIMLMSSFAHSADSTQCLHDTDALEHSLATLIRRQQIPGVIWLTTHRDGHQQAGALGYTSTDAEQPMSPEHIVRLGSITKTFNALLLHQLAQNDGFSLNDPLDRWLDKDLFKNNYQTSLTVNHLLEHTTGLPDMSFKEFDEQTPISTPLRTALLKYADQHHTRWSAGQQSYSNLNAALAGRVIEKVSEQVYETAMLNYLREQLNIQSGSFTPESLNITGYDTDGKTVIPYWWQHYRPLGGLNIRARDMGIVLRHLLEQGRALEQIDTSLGAGAGLQFGYAKGIYPRHQDGFVWYGHNGDADGHMASFGYNRDTGCGWFVAFNSYNQNALNIARRILSQAITQGRQAPPALPAIKPSDNLKQWAGSYQQQSYRFAPSNKQVQLRYHKQQLHLQYGKQLKPMIEVAPLRFRLANEQVATIALLNDKQQRWLVIDDISFLKK